MLNCGRGSRETKTPEESPGYKGGATALISASGLLRSQAVYMSILKLRVWTSDVACFYIIVTYSYQTLRIRAGSSASAGEGFLGVHNSSSRQ